MTKLSDIGEFGLIRRFSGQFKDVPGDITGIGDDCAVIPTGDQDAWLVTTDMLLEGRHFLLNTIKPFELGYKSLAVNLSDIAAMGGSAHSAYLSIAIPETIHVEKLDAFFEGIHQLCKETGTLFLGGDTTKSPEKMVISIMVLGKARQANIKYRSAAKPGDIVCVTDFLGDSGAGLKAIMDQLEEDKDTRYLIRKHNLPRPWLKEGLWLGDQPGIHAMMDVSDGIASDIQRIMERSGTGTEIDLDRVPISPSLERMVAKHGWNALELALTGGEDYCLMITLPGNAYRNIAAAYTNHFSNRLYDIGRITASTGALVFLKNGEKVDLKVHGFDHFRS